MFFEKSLFQKMLRFGIDFGSIFHDFGIILALFFQHCFGIDFGIDFCIDLGPILAPKWLPKSALGRPFSAKTAPKVESPS